MKKCVIVGGAEIKDYDRARSFINAGDYVIYCDCGLRHLEGLGSEPDLIIGDFDSYDDPHAACETITLPHIKDDTDTGYAAKEAVKRGYDECVLLGASGGRFDHTTGNVSLLLMLDEAGVKATLADDYCEMEILSGDEKEIPASYPYFSLLAVFGKADGVYIKDALYPLDNASISPDFQLGISNEVLPGKTARVYVTGGKMLLVKVVRP